MDADNRACHVVCGRAAALYGGYWETTDIHDERTRIDALVQMASHDSLTGLFNHNYARERIKERMEDRQAGVFALAIFPEHHRLSRRSSQAMYP